ncbi:Uncharacterized protein DAT39_014061, partial [Clarias magur]
VRICAIQIREKTLEQVSSSAQSVMRLGDFRLYLRCTLGCSNAVVANLTATPLARPVYFCTFFSKHSGTICTK